MSLKKDKRGIWGIILFFMILFTIVIIGFIAAIAMGLISYTSGLITPIMQEVGGDPDLNSSMGRAINDTFVPGNTVVQAFPWIIAFTYVLALIFVIAFVVIYKQNPHPAFIGFYLMMVLLLIFGCIVMSNMYQEIYSGDDILGTALHAQPLMSYMILYSPFIMGLIAIIGGIFMFTGSSDEGI